MNIIIKNVRARRTEKRRKDGMIYMKKLLESTGSITEMAKTLDISQALCSTLLARKKVISQKMLEKVKKLVG